MRCCASNEPARTIVRNNSMARCETDCLLSRRRYGAVWSAFLPYSQRELNPHRQATIWPNRHK